MSALMEARDVEYDPKELVLVRPVDVDGVISWLLHPGRAHWKQKFVEEMTQRGTKLVGELHSRMMPPDELWLCRSSAYKPSAMLGHEGLAIVRAGTIREYRLLRQY
ncbi:MAG: hypothetical protein JWP42_4220 [Pseudomonas sp.]|nr:hypothetical protein [Pseudomonas sp.]